MVKNLLVMQETQVESLGWEDSLEKAMAEHGDILTWRILQAKETSYSLWGHKDLDITESRYLWDRVKVKITQSCTTLCSPMDYTYLEFSRPEYWSE